MRSRSLWLVPLPVLLLAACTAAPTPEDDVDARAEPPAVASSVTSSSIRETNDAMSLARALLKGKAIVVTAARYEGARSAAGVYDDGPLGLKQGMLLTTGRAQGAAEPNARGNTSTDNKLGGSPLCDALVKGYKTTDAAKLTVTFDLAQGFDGISLLSVFGSEEFPEYVRSRYNDVYGVYLNGQQIVVDDTGAPITINGPFFTGKNVVQTPKNQTGYDGTTGVLKTRAPLAGGSKGNVLEIVVCDGGDRLYDSGAFLAELSGCEGDQCTGTKLCESVDEDKDGVNACSDCNDKDPSVRPGATEVADGKDNNCDGQIDEGTCAVVDADGDGVSACSDCNDQDKSVFPGAKELPDGKDNDCNGQVDEGTCSVVDADGDGVSACSDCNDQDKSVFPGAKELPDGKDNDCNGRVDDGLACKYSTEPYKQYDYLNVYGDSTTDITVGDVNGDGLSDVVVTATKTGTVFLGRPSGALVPSSYFYSAMPRIVLGDVNGDGKVDILYPLSPATKMSVHFGDGAGVFPQSPSLQYAVNGMGDGAVGDFNGDGIQDLVHSGTQAELLLGAPGRLGAAQPLPLQTFTSTVLARDINRDGVTDAIFDTYGPQVFLGGASGLSYRGQSNPAWETSDGRLADANADGHLDFASRIGPTSIGLYFGDSTGRLAYRSSFTVGARSPGRSWDVGDLDKDGKADIVSASSDAYLGPVTLKIHKGRSNADEALFDLAATVPLPSSTYDRLVLADVNGDGTPDIVLVNALSERKITLLVGRCE